MKYTAKEIKEMSKLSNFIETYCYKFMNGNIHTDNITYIGNGCFDDSEIDILPYDSNGMVDIDIVIMDADDYNSTIYANCSNKFEDEFYEGDLVSVIVVRK